MVGLVLWAVIAVVFVLAVWGVIFSTGSRRK